MIKLKNYWLNYTKKLQWDVFPKIAFTKLKNNKVVWFPDGKINIYHNCVLRHISKDNSKKAIIYCNEDGIIKYYTFKELDKLVLKFSNLLSEHGKIKKVMIHSYASIDTAVAMLACSKLGIHFSVIFEELEKDAIIKRIKLFKPTIIFSNKLKKNNFGLKIIKMDEYIKTRYKGKESKKLQFFKSNRDLFTLFTSGSTGDPKGITHGSGGYLAYAHFTCSKFFGIRQNSTVLSASDAGWINGHTYSLFGPLSHGATTVLIQRPTILLNIKILNKIIDEKINVLYLPVTLIRMMKSLYYMQKFKKKNIKTIGSMGEPLANEVGKWFAKAFGRKNIPIINTYFQTETGGIITSHKYNQEIKDSLYGSVGYPFRNQIIIKKLDKKKKEMKIISSWPGQMKGVLNGKKIWQKYFDNRGHFRMFDYATKINNQIYIHGRTDDVINISGHRIGSAEIESLILEIKGIMECSAVAKEDAFKGHELYIFFTCKEERKLENVIEKKILSNFGKFAIPKKIIQVSELPKTRSGKIMRRVLRHIIMKKKLDELKDISTILNKRNLKQLFIEITNAL